MASEATTARVACADPACHWCAGLPRPAITSPKPSWRLMHADVVDGLRQLPDASVHCVVTSPPYHGLRSYGVVGQLGVEMHLGAWVAAMKCVFGHVHRVLRQDGTLWLNIGDRWDDGEMDGQGWRLAFALQRCGWVLRGEVIWSKVNPMPEPVRARPAHTHERVFLLTRRRRYFYDHEAVKEPASSGGKKSSRPRGWASAGSYSAVEHALAGQPKLPCSENAALRIRYVAGRRNLRSVWMIASQPSRCVHFATFPRKLVEPCVRAGTSEYGVCSVCGAPWRRRVEPSAEYKRLLDAGSWAKDSDETPELRTGQGFAAKTKTASVCADYQTVGWEATCACVGAACIPATVLDPFAGVATAGVVALALGRSFIGIELNPEYVAMGTERLREAVGKEGPP